MYEYHQLTNKYVVLCERIIQHYSILILYCMIILPKLCQHPRCPRDRCQRCRTWTYLINPYCSSWLQKMLFPLFQTQITSNLPSVICCRLYSEWPFAMMKSIQMLFEPICVPYICILFTIYYFNVYIIRNMIGVSANVVVKSLITNYH